MRFQLEKGFSLIEVLISVAILAIAIIALVGVFPQGVHGRGIVLGWRD